MVTKTDAGVSRNLDDGPLNVWSIFTGSTHFGSRPLRGPTSFALREDRAMPRSPSIPPHAVRRRPRATASGCRSSRACCAVLALDRDPDGAGHHRCRGFRAGRAPALHRRGKILSRAGTPPSPAAPRSAASSPSPSTSRRWRARCRCGDVAIWRGRRSPACRWRATRSSIRVWPASARSSAPDADRARQETRWSARPRSGCWRPISTGSPCSGGQVAHPHGGVPL